MKAIYYNAKNEVVDTYHDVTYLSYEGEMGVRLDTITIRGRINGDPVPVPIAFIRLGKGERVQYEHEYNVPNTSQKLP